MTDIFSCPPRDPDGLTSPFAERPEFTELVAVTDFPEKFVLHIELNSQDRHMTFPSGEMTEKSSMKNARFSETHGISAKVDLTPQRDNSLHSPPIDPF